MTRVAVFGDSIAAGTYLPSSEAWPQVVAAQLGITVENLGVGGSLIHNPSPEIPNRALLKNAIASAVTEWAGNVPNAAVILCGANDMVEHAPEAPYPSNLHSTEYPRWELVYAIAQLHTAGVPNVYIVTLTPRAEGTLTDANPTWPGILNGRTMSFNDWVRAGYPGHHIDTRGAFGDIRSGLGNTAFFVGDGLHPNALGHKAIADRVTPFLRTKLGL